MEVEAIIATAGVGKRLESSIPKPFILLDHQPMILHTLRVFDLSPDIKRIILVVSEQWKDRFQEIIDQNTWRKEIHFAIGGQTRAESVQSGLRACHELSKYVVIHDGARPLVNKELIARCINAAQATGAAIAAVPVKATIKQADPKTMIVEKTIPRHTLWEIQTPQVFRKELLINAYQEQDLSDITDEAMLLERSGVDVQIVESYYHNIKVTTQEDIALVEQLLNQL